jgi:hypothetical protein
MNGAIIRGDRPGRHVPGLASEVLFSIGGKMRTEVAILAS